MTPVLSSVASAPISRRTALVGGLVSATSLALAACGSNGGIDVKNGVATIAIGATPQPHATILRWVQDNLAADAGLRLDIKEINDYQTPNSSLNDGSLAANYFQTPNFLKQQIDEKGYDFVSIADVHVEPLGLYSSTVGRVEDIPAGGSILLNNDPANTARGFKLLAQAGLITLDETVELPTDADIASNPKNLTFSTLEGAQVARSMQDADAAVINGNYALEADLRPSRDALILEQGGADSPYANELVVRTKDKDDEHLKKLAELMNSGELRTYIEQTWTDGSVLPAF